MSSTRPLRNILGLRAVVLVLLVTTVTAVFTGITSARAFSAALGEPPIETSMLPQQQGEGEREGESELPWLFAVFFITWAAFFAYVFVMSRRQREMQREIDALKRALAEREGETIQSEPGPESQA